MAPADRYHRQMLLPGWGESGQRRLSSSHALIIGVGALGCVSADLLARAGVGRLTLVDRDVVEWTNLQRQTLFTERDAEEALPKAEAARRRLAEVNGQIAIDAVIADFTSATATRFATNEAGAWPDVILDGTDNHQTRLLINDIAVRERVPYLYAGAVATHGMCMPVLPGEPSMPCLRCLFRDAPPPDAGPTCDTAGVLGPLIAMVAGYQAGEALKLLLGQTAEVSRTLLDFDPWQGRRRRVTLKGARDPECPCCGHARYEFLESGRRGDAIELCGRDAVQITPAAVGPGKLDLEALRARLNAHGSFESSPLILRGRLSAEGVNLTVFADGRTLIHGAGDVSRARSLYNRYIGG